MTLKLFTLQGKGGILMYVVGSVHHVRASRAVDHLLFMSKGTPALLKIEMPSGATYSTRPYGAHHSEKGAPQ